MKTLIDHEIRLSSGLSCNEYCIVDLFHHDWQKANAMTREGIAAAFGFSKATVINVIKDMVGKGWLTTSGRITTAAQKWCDHFETRNINEDKKEAEWVWKPAPEFESDLAVATV